MTFEPLKSVYRDDQLSIYRGEAENYTPANEGEDWPIDFILTNPYGPLPRFLMTRPMIVHQWIRNKAKLAAWCGVHLDGLRLLSPWNNGLEAFWVANFEGREPDFHRHFVDLRDLVPEPGGWYHPQLVSRILCLYGRPGMTIWDGFMGRGTVGAEARTHGIRYVGVERLPEHLALARTFLHLDS